MRLKLNSTNQTGLTLIEVLIAASISVVVALGLASMIVNFTRQQKQVTNSAGQKINQQGLQALMNSYRDANGFDIIGNNLANPCPAGKTYSAGNPPQCQ